jgi:hypothetical protein
MYFNLIIAEIDCPWFDESWCEEREHFPMGARVPVPAGLRAECVKAPRAGVKRLRANRPEGAGSKSSRYNEPPAGGSFNQFEVTV